MQTTSPVHPRHRNLGDCHCNDGQKSPPILIDCHWNNHPQSATVPPICPQAPCIVTAREPEGAKNAGDCVNGGRVPQRRTAILAWSAFPSAAHHCSLCPSNVHSSPRGAAPDTEDNISTTHSPSTRPRHNGPTPRARRGGYQQAENETGIRAT